MDPAAAGLASSQEVQHLLAELKCTLLQQVELVARGVPERQCYMGVNLPLIHQLLLVRIRILRHAPW